MKYFFLPAAVLSLLLGAALWSGCRTQALVEPWCAALEAAQTAAEGEDWDGAQAALRSLREDWTARQAGLHVVTAHDRLEDAEALLTQAERFAAAGEGPELRAAAAELILRLRAIADLQRLSLKNVL